MNRSVLMVAVLLVATLVSCSLHDNCTQVDDYELQPRFESAEQALANALANWPDASFEGATVDDYQREGNDQVATFQYLRDGTVHHEFSVLRTQDGQWAIGSRSGCVP